MKYDIYYNLRKKCLSVRDGKSRKVVGHIHRVWLADVDFKVSEAGRQRVLREKKKNVHAFVRGTPLAWDSTRVPLEGHTYLYYNPYTTKGFIDKNGKVVKSAKSVIINGKSVFAKGLEYAAN